MTTLIQRRVLALVPTLLGVGILIFFLMRLLPGDAVDAMLENASSVDPAAVEKLRRLFGLDRPLHEQFWSWLTALLTGDLGTSMRTRRPVIVEVAERLPATVELAVGSLLISILIAVPAGVVSATRRGSWSDLSARIAALMGLSMPSFWLGLLLIFVFAVVWRVLPASGYVPFTEDPIGNLKFAILPTVSLGTALAATTMRQTRSAMLEVLSLDYVRTARAKGVSERGVQYRHALRNALIPVVTVVGIQLGALLGGTVIIEQIFNWPGIGQMLIRAITQRDYPMVQGAVLCLAFFFILSNLLVDLMYTVLDPRIKDA